MSRRLLYFLLVIAAVVGAVAYCTTRTGVGTASKKEAQAMENRAKVAEQSATTTYAAAKAHEDSARLTHANPIIVVSASDTARIERIWSSIFAHPRQAPRP